MSTQALSATVADNILASILNGTAFTALTAYIQLHTGAPGANGTSNVASNSTREAIGTTSGSAGSYSNNATVTWTSVPTTETYTYCTLWSASSGGTFIASGTVTGGGVTAGDTFTFPATDFTVTFTVAA